MGILASIGVKRLDMLQHLGSGAVLPKPGSLDHCVNAFMPGLDFWQD